LKTTTGSGGEYNTLSPNAPQISSSFFVASVSGGKEKDSRCR
jgi:hypothetical protein